MGMLANLYRFRFAFALNIAVGKQLMAVDIAMHQAVAHDFYYPLAGGNVAFNFAIDVNLADSRNIAFKADLTGNNGIADFFFRLRKRFFNRRHSLNGFCIYGFNGFFEHFRYLPLQCIK